VIDSGQPVFVDTHAHLDDGRFEHDLAAVLATAAEVGVRRIVNIGYRPARWQSSIALAATNPSISFTLGLHPHHADEFTPELLANLRDTVESHRPVAIGEIGLDYFRDLSDRERQRRAFAAQLDLASEIRMPVVIHLRGEVEFDLRAALDQTAADLVCVLHSFDGSEDLAQYALGRGYFFGVGGLSTRKSNVTLRSILQALPIDRLLLETDAPYLPPANVKDRRNAPANVPLIASELATLKNRSIEEVARVTTANAERVFGLNQCDDELKSGGL
jgi:TatD DNase family protein